MTPPPPTPFPAAGPIRLLKTAFVVYNHADLPAARAFLLDFGLQIVREEWSSPSATGNVGASRSIFFAGYGSEPFVYVARSAPAGAPSSFGGAAYVVTSREELERAAATVSPRDPAAAIISLHSMGFPGGGAMVSLTDPAGHVVHLVHGQTEKAPTQLGLEKLVVNYGDEKRRVGKFQRFVRGRPAMVYRWGHYGVTYPEDNEDHGQETGVMAEEGGGGKEKKKERMFDAMFAWYTRVLGLAPSDFVERDSKNVTCFFHVDRGLEFSDHHAFFFKPAKKGNAPAVAHAAFEVHDFDTQQLGHQYLLDKGYDLCWGVGRHVLGSQVFDYWFDTSGFMVEHYADGDVVNKDTPTATVQAGPQALSVWGPPVPSVF